MLVVSIGGTTHLAPGNRWALALAVLAAVSLAMRRAWPLVTLAVVVVATSVYLVLGYPYGPILISVLVAGYTVARHLPLRRAAIAAAAAIAFLLVHAFVRLGVGPGLYGILAGSAWIIVAFVIGISLRLYRENVERDRAEWARRHADEERLRVAQEVHDVVGHGLSAIQMQADIALHVLPKQPGHAAVALAAISQTSREALDELRVALAQVTGGDGRAPLPGLARLTSLVERTSLSGVPVRIETSGTPRTLPGAVDLAAYRVVQESLTNVLRHAGAAAVTVEVGYGAEEVTVRVRDTGRGGAVGPGQGIDGMRERVLALGGSFAAGPAEQGGFHVTATLPAP